MYRLTYIYVKIHFEVSATLTDVVEYLEQVETDRSTEKKSLIVKVIVLVIRKSYYDNISNDAVDKKHDRGFFAVLHCCTNPYFKYGVNATLFKLTLTLSFVLCFSCSSSKPTAEVRTFLINIF